jgi:hypothetical protein
VVAAKNKSVTDGRFAETKDVVGGYTLVGVTSSTPSS